MRGSKLARILIARILIARILLALVATICVVLLCDQVRAFPIHRILFSGVSRLSESELLGAIRAEGDPLATNYRSRAELLLAMQTIQRTIGKHYAQEGFYYATIDSFQLALHLPTDTAAGYDATIYLREGKPYRIASIAIKNATLVGADELRAGMNTSIGTVLVEKTLEADIDAMLERYERAGFPMAHIEIESIKPQDAGDAADGNLAITLNIIQGRQARIERIAIAGNSITSSDVILRELRIVPGSIYDSRELERARARIERLGFFESVSEPQLFVLTDSTLAVLLTVREANTSAIDAVLGYIPGRTTSDKGYIMGLANLDFRNISGTGRSGRLSYAREDQSSQQLEVHYLEPWLFGWPLNAAIGFQEREQDSSYTRMTIDAALTLLFTEDMSIAATGALERVTPTDLPSYPFTAFDSKTLSYGLTAKLDTRDNSLAPRTGIVAALSASYGVKSIYGPTRFLDSATSTSVGIRTVGLDVSGYVPTVSPRIIAAIGLHARTISAFGGNLDQSDFSRLGGLRTIRGYREAELLASGYAYTNLEARVMTGSVSYLFLFLDAGYLVKSPTRTDAIQTEQHPLSYGLGAQVESPLGVLSVSAGLPSGEPLDQLKIHFGLVTQF